ncbi:MAG: bifunctional N-acetylglucosamine-1-phosphate uridyltransferase/glucosamine-1-phosphate acetyltransferase [Rickettsiales bacterium]|nr:bifunctional N-acetylglucosamine-1-phosphate uridyltransferase/glucosamine-1-phosphate acetyltransferase [Rickettsiales bacterium]
MKNILIEQIKKDPIAMGAIASTHNKDIAALVLAAGKGSRMKSSKPKVMHKLAGLPLISHVIDSVSCLNPKEIYAIIAPDMEKTVGEQIKPHGHIFQREQMGTGHAVMQAKSALQNFKGTVLIMLGDVPLIDPRTIASFLNVMNKEENTVQLLTFEAKDPTGYGRVFTNMDASVSNIIEHKDCSKDQLSQKRVWSGIMAVDGEQLFPLLNLMTNDNAQGEYYLTQIVELANASDLRVGFMDCDEDEVQGVNTKANLAQLEARLQDRLRSYHLENGVTMIAPETVTFSMDTTVGPDTVIEPNVVFCPKVEIAKNCFIRAFSHLEECRVGEDSEIGPFARLRPGTKLDGKNVIGNFVEIKGSEVGTGSKIKHLSYVGNAEVGDHVNLGAGTITCNYNGYEKYKTVFEDGVLTGVNTVCIAPVSLGAFSMTGAGSVITKDVEAGSLAIARSEQTNKEGWADRFHADNQHKKKAKKAS